MIDSDEGERGRLGIGGSQPRTQDGHGNSIKQFNQFVDLARHEKKGIGRDKLFKHFDDWTAEEFADEMVF